MRSRTTATTAASNSLAPPLISSWSVIAQFHEFDECTGEVTRVDERDPCAATPGTWLGVNEPGSGGLEVDQGGVDVDDGVSNVVKTFAVLGQKLSHGSVGRERLEQLNVGTAHRDHGFLHALTLDSLSIERLDAILALILGDSVVEVVHRNGNVVEVQQLHDRQAITTDAAGTIVWT